MYDSLEARGVKYEPPLPDVPVAAAQLSTGVSSVKGLFHLVPFLFEVDGVYFRNSSTNSRFTSTKKIV